MNSARQPADEPTLDKQARCRGSGIGGLTKRGTPVKMLNAHCGVDHDPRGVVRLTICNAGSLNILSSPVIDGVRQGFEQLASDRSIRAVVLAGQSEKSMIGGADIKEMAKLDQASAEAFITRLRDLCEAVRAFPAPVKAHTWAGRPTPRGSTVDTTSPSAASRASCCRAASAVTPAAFPRSAVVCGPRVFSRTRNRSAEGRGEFSK